MVGGPHRLLRGVGNKFIPHEVGFRPRGLTPPRGTRAKCDWLSGTYARDRRESQCGMENELLDMFADANSITSEASNKVLTRKNAI